MYAFDDPVNKCSFIKLYINVHAGHGTCDHISKQFRIIDVAYFGFFFFFSFVLFILIVIMYSDCVVIRHNTNGRKLAKNCSSFWKANRLRNGNIHGHCNWEWKITTKCTFISHKLWTVSYILSHCHLYIVRFTLYEYVILYSGPYSYRITANIPVHFCVIIHFSLLYWFSIVYLQ